MRVVLPHVIRGAEKLVPLIVVTFVLVVPLFACILVKPVVEIEQGILV